MHADLGPWYLVVVSHCYIISSRRISTEIRREDIDICQLRTDMFIVPLFKTDMIITSI